MAERLAIIRKPPVDVLDWWGNVGGGSAALRQACPRAQVTRVDAEWVAARAAPRRWPWQRKGLAAPIAAADVPDGAADLVWSNMAMHFEPDRAALPAAWMRALRVDGFLMFSTFGPDTLRELRAIHGRQAWGPLQAPFEDMHDIGDRLVASGFADPVMDQETLTLTYASAQSLLDDLHALGANLHPARFAGLRTPRWQSRWGAELARRAGADGRIAITFEIAYGHAIKPAARALVAERTVVKLDALREMLRRGRQ